MKIVKFDYTSLILQISPCSQKCKHCFMSTLIEKPLPFEDVKNIFDNYSKVLANPAITDSARLAIQDEPTLYPEIIELLSYARELGLVYMPLLSTNGIGLIMRAEWKEILDEFRKSGVKVLNMSLFGEKDYHNWFAGRNDSYQLIRRAAQRAKDTGFRLKWNLFVTSQNADQIARLAEELEEDWHSISIPFYSKNWHNNSALPPSIEDLAPLPKESMQWIESYYKSESQWVDICSNPKEIEKLLSGSEENPDHKSKAIYLRNNILYDYHWDLPQFQLGNIMKDSLRDIYLIEDKSPGIQSWLKSDVSALAEKYGNTENSKLGHLKDYWFVWHLMSDEV
jgi:MoaA/NifB/PqqE/SkfB family radical SAM enzyme